MQCVMHCMIVHEWNVWVFKLIFFWICFIPFSSFLVLTNAKCKCHLQMPWLVLPMRYATIVPQYAIDRLLITNLDVNFLWMQTKCDANLDFSFPMLMLLDEDAKCNFLFMMQMSHARMKTKSLFMMILVHEFKPWCKCLLMGMSWCKCFDPDTNYSKIPFIFKMRFPQPLKPKYSQNLIYYSWKVMFFFT